jgi:hypothetical protein
MRATAGLGLVRKVALRYSPCTQAGSSTAAGDLERQQHKDMIEAAGGIELK